MNRELTIADRAEAEVRVQPASRPSLFIWCKRFVQLLVVIVVLPRLTCYWIASRLLGRRAFLAASESIARVPGMRGVFMRQAFYRLTMASCCPDAYLGWQSTFSMPEAEIGERAYVGRYCSIGFAQIGDEVMIADGVQILSGGREHGRSTDNDATMQQQAQSFTRVAIGSGAWIGAGAIIMADVGEGAIVGAGAVVNKPVPPRCVAVGVPARVVKEV